MAKLSDFKQDAGAISNGAWIRVGEEYGDIEIKTRGFTDAFLDAQAAALRKAAQSLGGDTAKIPASVRRAVNKTMLIRHLLLDVRNLVDDDGNEMSKEDFVAVLEDPNYADLLNACYTAAAMVGRVKQAEVADASGN